jgi:hypothetical protein
LDRIYISSLLCDNIKECNILPCTLSDHDFVYLKVKTNNIISFGKSYWKFNNSVLEDEDFIFGFEYYWHIISRTNEITLKWWDDMKLKIKDFCFDYSKHKNKNLYNRLKKNS